MKNKIKGSIVAMIMSAALVGTLAGCSNADNTATTDDVTTTESSTADSTQTEATAPENDGAETTEQGTDQTADAGQADSAEMEVGTYPDGSSPTFSDVRLRLTIGDQEVIVRMYDNTAVDAFLERLPLENLNFFDLSGIEKPIAQPDDPFSIADETPGYDPVTGEMVIYRPWGNFTFFYGDFRHSDELVPLGHIESGLDILAGQTEDFTGTLEIME